jgi:ABC-type multidrug transport system ATPase subunit
MTISIKGNEVFTLLGHNGAGKTTAIYMLTGMLNPSGGNAVLYDNTVSSEMDEIRKNLGLCQQFDVLYDELTAEEHLLFACKIKDVGADTESEIRDTLELVMLTRHKEKKPTEMSGGMKRKLSLALALIGKSRTIILDEPTSGLDVESRRQVWELILKIRETRSIIMSTQHIEEADVLSNRICVMSHGKVIALDTPNNIKRRFGVGYNVFLEPINQNNMSQ